jgi:hypothetical protein
MARNDETGTWEIGDIICRSGSYRSPGKIIAVKFDPNTTSRQVTYMVVTGKNRIATWTGYTWGFVDPMVEVEYKQRKARCILDMADGILAKVDKLKNLL